ncbi:MAG: protein kinase [Bacillota bacterium]|nr:protein kinase [Bacillota bacterium]
MDNLTGKIINSRYRIQSVLGVGGMSVVYKAVDLTTDETVAIKVLKNEFLNDSQFRNRFKTESKVIEMLSSPNIVKIYNVGFNDDLYYIVMECIDGITLKQYIEQQGKLTWRETLYFITQILKALSHAHERGIVHRDIKPQNIMLLHDGTIKVTDFGIARMPGNQTNTITDRAIGSVHYISPEQVSGEKTDERSDLYAVGIMMYEMLTGKVPFDAENPVSVALMQMQNKPKPPKELVEDLPVGLEEIVLKAMSKNPENRYPTARAFLEDIEKFKQNPSIVFEYKYFPDDDKKFGKAIDNVKNRESSPEKKKTATWALAGTITALVLIAAGVIGALVAGGGKKASSDIAVPNLIGQSYDSVRANQEYKNFNIIESQTANNNDYDEGVIFAQSPSSGMTVKKGADIRVSVSLGKKKVTVPNLANFDYRQACIDLDKINLKYEIAREYNDTVMSDYVIRTDPGASQEVNEGDTIKIYVSLGKEIKKVKVPKLVDGTEEDAKKALESQKLVSNVTTVESDKPKGTVISQSIPADSEVDEGTVVGFQVSDGSKAPKTQKITISLPTNKESVLVEVYQSGKLVYNAAHQTSEKYVEVELSGNGTQTVEIYIDGTLQRAMSIVFD